MRIRSVTYPKGELAQEFIYRCERIYENGYDRIHIMISHNHGIEHLAKVCNKIENQIGLSTQITDYYV